MKNSQKAIFFVFIIVEKSLHLYVLIRVLVNKIFLIYNYDLFKLLIASDYTLSRPFCLKAWTTLLIYIFINILNIYI